MDKLHLNEPNSVHKNIEAIEELFPHCVAEVKNDDGELTKVVDFDLLKQELSQELVDGEKERYQLTWPGKKEALLEANLPTAKTLRPCREESVDFDSTQNLFIEGDNLEALKLLQESYLGKVKMIYIDPPYNTGNDFIYRDKFKASIEDHLRDSGQTDEAGNRLVANTEANGRFHSDWLSMMYPRLKLAKNLLRDDGVIFISIDDNEVHNLRRMCDEIYGGGNFVCVFNWATKRGAQGMQTKNMVVPNHEYILVYAQNKSLFTFLGETRSEAGFSNPDKDPRGLWKRQHLQRLGQNLPVRTIVNPQNGMKFSFETPYTQENIDLWVSEERIIFPAKANKYPTRKEFLNEYKTNKQLVTALGVYSTKSGTEQLYKLFEGDKIFTNPKPSNLLLYLLRMVSKKDDSILDFFAGSATTAHAVLELNKEDGGNRRYIMVQLREPCNEKSQAFKQGYQTVADIGKERIRRVAKKIKEDYARENKRPKPIDENPERTIESLDIGFRVLKVASSSRRAVDSVPDKVKQLEIPVAVDNIKEDRSSEDILFQILLSWGVDLSLPIAVEKILGLEVFCVDENSLLACFAKDGAISDGVCIEIAKKEPLRVVFRDAGFGDDSAKLSAKQIFKLKSPNTEIRVI